MGSEDPGLVQVRPKLRHKNPHPGVNDAVYDSLAVKTPCYGLAMKRTADGAAVIVISSDLEEILRISDRVAVMHEGDLTGVLKRAEASEEAIMRLAFGHSK